MSTSDDRMAASRERVKRGHQLQEQAQKLKDKGLSNAAIAHELGISENTVRYMVTPMELHDRENIWFPLDEAYTPREQHQYKRLVINTSSVLLNSLVIKRAKEDGEWAIENELVGDNEDKMRRFMAFVSDPVNIEQCVAHIVKDGRETEATVDWVCRELAKASKVMIR